MVKQLYDKSNTNFGCNENNWVENQKEIKIMEKIIRRVNKYGQKKEDYLEAQLQNLEVGWKKGHNFFLNNYRLEKGVPAKK